MERKALRKNRLKRKVQKMPKEISKRDWQTKDCFIVCCYCKKPKHINKYKYGWQLNNNICNNCRIYHGIDSVDAVVTRAKESKKFKTKCLKCDMDILTDKYNRICNLCKGRESYAEEQYAHYITTGLAQ